MSTQILSTLSKFQSYSRNFKTTYLKNCSKDFIQFLNKCIVKLLIRELQKIQNRHVKKYQDKIHQRILKINGINKRRAILISRKGIEFISILTQQLYKQKFNINVHKLDQSEEIVNIVRQNLDPLHKDITSNTKSIKNESVVDQKLKCPRIKLSLSESFLLDERDTNVAFTDFTYALKRKNIEFPDIYCTILDATGINPTKIVNKAAKSKDSDD